MIEDVRPFEDAPDGFVVFHAAGAQVAAACRCADCGYGVAVFRTLPRCPMCGGETWEEELLQAEETLHLLPDQHD